MKRVWPSLALAAFGVLLALSPAGAQTCSIGGHNETSENFAPGGWAIAAPPTPGTVPAILPGAHLLISEVAPQGITISAGSDSSEFIEIYNPTPMPIKLDNKYISDDIGYYRIVNGAYPVAQVSDFALKFPTGLSLLPGRTLVLCVTKSGFAASGGSAAAAQYFLEMRDSNGNLADDMVNVVTGTTFPNGGGMMTNPSSSAGEWVVLYCWDGVSDRVCDVDYASWGANNASNPKMNKTGISIDGPDAGATVSAFAADTPAGTQTNLGAGTVLAKPNSYQRTGGEMGETTFAGNGCIGIAVPVIVTWGPVVSATGQPDIKFHIRWQNPDEDASSSPITGQMFSQEFGVFLPDFGSIGQFNVPPLQPNSFFDVFFEVPLSSLPPAPQKILPGSGGNLKSAAPATYGGGNNTANNCPPDTNWAGNVDIQWSSAAGQGGQVNKHYGDLLTCAGGPPSYIHVRPSNCTSPMPWSTTGVCPGYSVTLVNENFSAAPNPVPVGWSGFICVSTAAAVPLGTSCCFGIVFGCNGATSTIDICSTACDWQVHKPTLTDIDWTTNGTMVKFHQRWANQSATATSDPVSGTQKSQAFGVFLPDYGPIGTFNVPAMAPNSFFDVFFDVSRASLPPEPVIQLPGSTSGTPNPCVEDHWHGNVDISWNGPGGSGQANKHFGEMPVCPGAGPTYLFVETNCASPFGATWNITGLCPGFSATLANTDSTPAPNPVPQGWIGLICVSAPASTPVGDSCCFKVEFLCGPVPGAASGIIDVCVKTCTWAAPTPPVLTAVDWTRIGTTVRFHQHWENQSPSSATDPVSGNMSSQSFGVFLPDFGPIGSFNIPPIPVNSFFDVFFDVPLAQLPPEPQRVLPGGGPQPGSPCPPDTSWSGNVDINWAGAGGTGQVGRHFTSLLVRPGFGSSHVHTLIFCNSTAGATWSIAGLCPGFTATLLNENFTPAPNPVPPGWTGWISVAAAGALPSGVSCCFTVTFTCDGHPGVIDVCAETCLWPNTGVPVNSTGVAFGIYATAPNPTNAGMVINYAMPNSGTARLEIFNLSGQRVRTLLDGQVEAGVNTVRWDGRGEGHRTLPPGAYFVTLRAGEQVASKKIVLFH